MCNFGFCFVLNFVKTKFANSSQLLVIYTFHTWAINVGYPESTVKITFPSMHDLLRASYTQVVAVSVTTLVSLHY